MTTSTKDKTLNATILQGSSNIYDMGTTPNTRTAVSQKVRILTPSYGATGGQLLQMGALSNFNPSETRTIDPLRGIGFGDQIAELVPSVTDPMGISFERALLYLNNLWQATGYAGGIDGPARSLRHHRWPFDIRQEIVLSTLADDDLGVANVGKSGAGFEAGSNAVEFPNTNSMAKDMGGFPADDSGHTAILTFYEACWWGDWNTTFSRDSGMIMENGTATASDVHDSASVYGEFLSTGNDPTIGQLGSLRYQ